MWFHAERLSLLHACSSQGEKYKDQEPSASNLFECLCRKKKEKWYTLCIDCHCMLAYKYISLQFWMKIFRWFDVVCDEMRNQTFMWWDANFLLYLGLGWNDHVVYMGCVNEAQIGSCACCHIAVHVAPCHCHVSSYVIDHVKLHDIVAIHVISMSTAMSSSMSLICDMAIEFVMKIILFMTFIIVIENRLGMGFRGPGTFYDAFKTSLIKQSVIKF